MLGRRGQNEAIAGCQQTRLVGVSAAPYRSNRVDDESRGEAKARGDADLSGRSANAASKLLDLAAGCQELGARCRVNRAVDAAAAEQRLVGSVDDRFDPYSGDVTESHVDQCHGPLTVAPLSSRRSRKPGDTSGATLQGLG
mgnify:CR=1 FL=1